MVFKANDLSGRVFGRITLSHRVGTHKDGHALWKGVCSCGTEVIVSSGDLNRTNHPTRSCGCLLREIASARASSLVGEKALRYGKPAAHGYGAWYTKDIWMRSSWEIAVATLLDKMHVRWEYEPEAFPITYEGKQGTYRPDFYLPDKHLYIEVKGYWRDDAKVKFEAFTSQYPEKGVLLLDKAGLQRMGFI